MNGECPAGAFADAKTASQESLFLHLLGLGVARRSLREKKQSAPPAQQAAPAVPSASAPTVELPSFVTLVKKEGLAVVNVTAVRTIQQTAEAGPGADPDEPLAEFFRRFMPPQGAAMRPKSRG